MGFFTSPKTVQKRWRILLRRVGAVRFTFAETAPTGLIGTSRWGCMKKTWTNVQQFERCDKPFQCAYCQFIMGLIVQLMRSTMNDDK